MSARRMDTAMNRVLGLGSAKEGVGHWWSQRVTSIALIPLTVLFAPPFIGALGAGHAAVLDLYRSPLHAIVAMLFIAVSCLHLQQGLQVVVEDYVHDKWPRTALLLGNTMGAALLAVAGVYAVLRISFSA